MNTDTPDATDELTPEQATWCLGLSLAETANWLAGLPVDEASREWRDAYYQLTARHPRLEARAGAAGWCSLGQLRLLATDPDPRVRIEAAGNRFAVDADIQLLLAGDPVEDVVLALLRNIDPGLEAALRIIEGPHVEARRVLAFRRLRTDLVERLATDDDPFVRLVAEAVLDQRAARRGAAA